MEDSRQVGSAPALDGERPECDQARRAHDRPGGAASFQGRDEDADDDGRAADEHTRYRGFRRALRSQDRAVEADHSDGGEDSQPAPLPQGEHHRGDNGQAAAAQAQKRQEQQGRETVPERLTTRPGVVAENTVRREGGADQDAGEGREQGSTQGGCVHEGDARFRRGPV